MYNKIKNSLFFVCLLSVFCFGQAYANSTNIITKKYVVDAFKSEQKIPKTFLWKIEKKGMPTSYLLGAIHLGKENSVLPTHVENAFKQVETVMTESTIEGQEENAYLGQQMFLSSVPLSKTIGQEHFEYIAKNMNFTRAEEKKFLEKMTLWAAAVISATFQSGDYTASNGIDMMLMKKADVEGKNRVALETAWEMTGVFRKMPEEKLVSFLNASFNSSKDKDKEQEIMAIVSLYHKNQTEKLLAFLTKEEIILQDFPKAEHNYWREWFYQELLIDRSKKWIPKIEAQIAKQPTLVAVGAGHLYGKVGVIELLQQKGYKLTPVLPAAPVGWYVNLFLKA